MAAIFIRENRLASIKDDGISIMKVEINPEPASSYIGRRRRKKEKKKEEEEKKKGTYFEISCWIVVGSACTVSHRERHFRWHISCLMGEGGGEGEGGDRVFCMFGYGR